MPRGNDAQEAAAELKERFGEGVGNVENVLRAAAQTTPPELQAAQLKPVDEEATAELDLDEVASKADLKKGQVLSATVHSEDIVYAWVDDEHRVHKGVLVDGKDVAESAPDRHLERIHGAEEAAEAERKTAAAKKANAAAEKAAEKHQAEKAKEAEAAA